VKRLHIHVAVDDLGRSIDFYSTLFGAAPSMRQGDYAKWMLDDPRVNFAISDRSRAAGIDHLGIQVESREELSELADRLKSAGAVTLDQAEASCCYATSDKSWVKDPSGVSWETFFSFGTATVYGEDTIDSERAAQPNSACCEPAAAPSKPCCGPS
jgi:catechol 2,3-dioxygenase-like lactoylglutathione lyase family enzyme